jgi:hypothetical protein
VSKPPPSAEALREKKLRQAIIKAEKSTVIFNADLGSVPVMNRDTLARKVTLLLHDKARMEGDTVTTRRQLRKRSTTSSPARH